MLTESFERVQTGVRLEKRLMKVLKGLAEYHDVPLCELMEIMFLKALEGDCSHISGTGCREQIEKLKEVYGLDYTFDDYLKTYGRPESEAQDE